jgi:hypothetical protein
MEIFFRSNPGFRSRVAHHLEFPDYSKGELHEIAQLMMENQSYLFDDQAQKVLREYISLRMTQPHFANARSIRNAIDRAKLRQANRLFEDRSGKLLDREALMTIEASDIQASRIFTM